MNYVHWVMILVFSFQLPIQSEDQLPNTIESTTIITEHTIERSLIPALGIAFLQGFIPGFVCATTGCALGAISTDKNAQNGEKTQSVASIILACIASYYIADYFTEDNQHPSLIKASQLSGIFFGTVLGIGIASVIN